MFLLVPAYPGCPGSKAVKRSLLLLLPSQRKKNRNVVIAKASATKILPLRTIEAKIRSSEVHYCFSGVISDLVICISTAVVSTSIR